MRQITFTVSGARGDDIDQLLMYHSYLVLVIQTVLLPVTWICQIFSWNLDCRILEFIHMSPVALVL